MPLADDFDEGNENVNRVIMDKVSVGLDYPCYPLLPGSSSKPMNVALQYLIPLSKTNPNIRIVGQEASLTSDHIIEPSGPIGVERAEYFQRFLSEHAHGRVKGTRVCVLGAFTLASYLDLRDMMHCGASKPEVVKTLTSILSRTCKRLSDLGIDLVCIDEPFLTLMLGRKGKVLFKYDEQFILDSLNALLSQLSGLSSIHVCGTITPLIKDILLASKADILDHEFTQNPKNEKFYSKEELESTNKFLAYGCVSTTKLGVESVREISATLENALRRYGDQILAKPDCAFGGMLGVPQAYDIALRKLRNMVAAAKQVLQEHSN